MARILVVDDEEGVRAFLAEALEAEGMAQSVNFYTDDTKEAITAFLEKREPKFKGR